MFTYYNTMINNSNTPYTFAAVAHDIEMVDAFTTHVAPTPMDGVVIYEDPNRYSNADCMEGVEYDDVEMEDMFDTDVEMHDAFDNDIVMTIVLNNDATTDDDDAMEGIEYDDVDMDDL